MLLSRFGAELVFHLWLQDSFLMKVIKNNNTSLRYRPYKITFWDRFGTYIWQRSKSSKDTKKNVVSFAIIFPWVCFHPPKINMTMEQKQPFIICFYVNLPRENRKYS